MCFAALLLVIALAAAIAYVALRDVSATPLQSDSGVKTDEARCGKCAYFVRGLETFICPECGSDLRQVGIDVGRRKGYPLPWLPPVLAIGVWTLVIGFAWSQVTHDLERSLPRVRSTNYTITFTGPRSNAYAKVDVSGSANVPESVLAPAATDLSLVLVTDRGIASTLTLDVRADTFSYTTPDGGTISGKRGFGRLAVREWLARCTGSSDVKLNTEADDIADVATAAPVDQRDTTRVTGGGSSMSGSSGNGQESGSWSVGDGGGGPFKSVGGSYTSSLRVVPAFSIGFLLGAVVVWLIGALAILRRLAPRRTVQP